MKVIDKKLRLHYRLNLKFTDGLREEQSGWDPKDGELCLNRVKSMEM
jgi:hypothetical protein